MRLVIRRLFAASWSVVAVCLAPALALAQEDARTDEPNVRVDAVFPSAGFGGFFAPDAHYSRGIFIAGLETRWTHASGHGGMVRGAWGTSVWGSGYGADLAYLYRARLVGDRDVSLSLDSMIGPTFAALEHNEDSLPLGVEVGGHLSFSLDFRARNFILALGLQYRVLFPTQAAIDGSSAGAQHVLTGTLGVGFTIY